LAPPPPSDDVPEAVKALLIAHITDFEELELLLLLQRSPDDVWALDAAATQLRVPVPLVENAAEALRAHGLLSGNGVGYRFAPSSPALRDACDQLRASYDQDRFAIVTLMSRLAVERLRSSAARAFASAFRIRKPPGEE
jgi:hypothetical protein